MKLAKKNSGATLVETLTAALITPLVLGGVVLVYLAGATSWSKGHASIAATASSQTGVRTVCELLRNAMWISVSEDGNTVRYRMPLQDSKGDFIIPAQSDSVFRSLTVSGSNLISQVGAGKRIICSHIVSFDPLTRDRTPYRVFTAGPGAVPTSLTVELATSEQAPRGQSTYGRNRETIYLRNMPEGKK